VGTICWKGNINVRKGLREKKANENLKKTNESVLEWSAKRKKVYTEGTIESGQKG